VDDTRGEVMTYNGRLVIAYFHANSGGFTEDARNVWVADLPYLRGVRDPFSQNIPKGEWKIYLPYRTVQDRLNRYGLNVGNISGILVCDVTDSGRPQRIVVISSLGKTELKSNDFRIKIGPTRLKSKLFHLYEEKDGLLINGKGFGNGVGMSQSGAYQMAKAGHNYREILSYYYKGIHLSNLISSR